MLGPGPSPKEDIHQEHPHTNEPGLSLATHTLFHLGVTACSNTSFAPHAPYLAMMEIAVFAGCACGTVAFLLFLQYVLLAVLMRVLDKERRKLADERRRFTAEVRALISLRTSQADVPCTVEARVALCGA